MQISDAREKEEARLKQEKFMRMKTEMEEDRKQAVENKKQREIASYLGISQGEISKRLLDLMQKIASVVELD